MEKLCIKAKLENLVDVTAFVESQLETLDLPMKTQMQIDLAVEEIFVNIANYAYSPEDGLAIIEVELTEDPRVIITFIDNGKPFDPLAKEDPDVTQTAEDRKVGGLGIFMVKKSMDDVSYEYKDGQNILRIEKRLGVIER
ncbi:MAG: ATP-binding protein [Oscillospiraceae bacterium]|nr:ATP-binding protein [Oscillospiraceae bacterium]